MSITPQENCWHEEYASEQRGALDRKGDPAVREYWTRIPDTRLDRGLEVETPGGNNHDVRFVRE